MTAKAILIGFGMLLGIAACAWKLATPGTRQPTMAELARACRKFYGAAALVLLAFVSARSLTDWQPSEAADGVGTASMLFAGLCVGAEAWLWKDARRTRDRTRRAHIERIMKRSVMPMHATRRSGRTLTVLHIGALCCAIAQVAVVALIYRDALDGGTTWWRSPVTDLSVIMAVALVGLCFVASAMVCSRGNRGDAPATTDGKDG